eukprot:1158844-Pelagomonas_calceolata.AAC.8
MPNLLYNIVLCVPRCLALIHTNHRACQLSSCLHIKINVPIYEGQWEKQHHQERGGIAHDCQQAEECDGLRDGKAGGSIGLADTDGPEAPISWIRDQNLIGGPQVPQKTLEKWQATSRIAQADADKLDLRRHKNRLESL